uniref:Uncharacterized protein TCIL3000_10_11790 n=1 Tax=Trypanosoma congolense (strain IL3000) TaxID=1068625 RepID=G0UYD1_TRYCI|nr:unnamed protein product [Trypanosoma congolense IL3000]
MACPYDGFAPRFRQRLSDVIRNINQTVEHCRLQDDIRQNAGRETYEALEEMFPARSVRSSPSRPPTTAPPWYRCVDVNALAIKTPRSCRTQEMAENVCDEPSQRHSGLDGSTSQSASPLAQHYSYMNEPQHSSFISKYCPHTCATGRGGAVTPNQPANTRRANVGPSRRPTRRVEDLPTPPMSIRDVSVSSLTDASDIKKSPFSERVSPIPAPELDSFLVHEASDPDVSRKTAPPTSFISQALITAQQRGLVVNVLQPEGRVPQLRLLRLSGDDWNIFPLPDASEGELNMTKCSNKSAACSPVSPVRYVDRVIQNPPSDGLHKGESLWRQLSASLVQSSSISHYVSIPHALFLYPYGVLGSNCSACVGGVVCGSAARRLLLRFSCPVFVQGMEFPYRVFVVNCRDPVCMRDSHIESVCTSAVETGLLMVLQFGSRLDWLIFLLVSMHVQEQQETLSAPLSYGRALWMLAAQLWYERGVAFVFRVPKLRSRLRSLRKRDVPALCSASPLRASLFTRERDCFTSKVPSSSPLGPGRSDACGASFRFSVPPAGVLQKSPGFASRDDSPHEMSGRRFGVLATSKSPKNTQNGRKKRGMVHSEGNL